MAVGTWSLTLREEHRLRVFENKVLRRIFSPKMHEARGDWRKLHNGELYNVYSSPSTIRMIKSRRMKHTWGEGECIQDFGGQARTKETTRKI
jgi:hypothetical protein